MPDESNIPEYPDCDVKESCYYNYGKSYCPVCRRNKNNNMCFTHDYYYYINLEEKKE